MNGNQHPDEDARPTKRPKLSRDDDLIEPTASSKPVAAEQQTGSSVTSDLREMEVGITAFVSQESKPFAGVLKKRYTDFLVNEILPNGEVVHLRSTAVPQKFQPRTKNDRREDRHNSTAREAAVLPQSRAPEAGVSKNEEVSSQTEGVKGSSSNDSHSISEEDEQELVNHLNAEAVSELLGLYQSIVKNPQRKPQEHPLVRTEFTSDRSIRADIHGCIRRVFSSRIESSTDHNGYLVLTAAHPNNRQNGSRNGNNTSSSRPGKLSWNDRGGEFLHFTLYKENKDTMEAISYLVRQMKVNAKVFQFAGTKDRRAVTSQRVSAHRLDVGRLAGLNKALRGARVGDFSYHHQGLELGDLAGNEFTITLRECALEGPNDVAMDAKVQTLQSTLEEAMTSLHHRGYLNYFGLQRFGTFSTRTDKIGLHILKGDFQAAVEAILHYNPDAVTEADKKCVADNMAESLTYGDRSEDTSRAIALYVFKVTSNAQKAIAILPRKFNAEATLMRHLQRQAADYLGALLTIPRNLRLMYVHAYQSLVWNNATSNRMAKYGSTVVEGDLVLISEHRDKNEHLKPGSGDPSDPVENDVDADGEIVIAPPAHDRSTNIDDIFERARHLTAEEANGGKYNIFDIVLPLPGYDILYPDHETGAFYKSFMAQHGNLDPMDMRRKHRDFSLSGSYRKVVSRIGADWTVDVRPYTMDNEQFVKTDMDLIKETEKEQKQGDQPDIVEKGQERNALPSGAPQQSVDQGEMGKEKVAAVLKFKLGSSQYATMALRELSRGGVIAHKPEFSGVKTRPG